MDKVFLEDCLAQGMSLKEIGRRVGKHPSTIAYWLKKHGLNATGAGKYTRRGALDRQRLKTLVESGADLRKIAEQLDRSVSTVRYWMAHYGFSRSDGRLPREGDGSKVATFECVRHGVTDFVLEGRGYYRCRRCRAAAVAKRRRKIKQTLVEEAGGCCVLCGYNRWIGALQFHHLDPSTKEFQIGQRGHTRSLARCVAEAQKCILLCANCHAEVEGGFASLPQDLRRTPEDAVAALSTG